MRRQTYEIVNIVDAGDKVAVEAIFRASFKRDVGDLSAGDIMMAHLAMFFEIRDGKIVRHHSYDCIVPSNTARPT